MCALFTPLLGNISGRIGANVFARNAAGGYIRNGTIPVNPNTPRQAVVKAGLSQANFDWQNVLTPEQRADWKAYGLASPTLNRQGQSILVPGREWYIGRAAFAIANGLTTPSDAPTQNGSAPLVGWDYSTNGTDIEAANPTLPTTEWFFMQFQVSGAQNLTVNSFKGPWESTVSVLFSAPEPHVIIPAPLALSGRRYFIASKVADNFGRIARVPVINFIDIP